MANRFVVTGVQIGMILGCVRNFEHDPVNCSKTIEGTLQEIQDNQHIGYTQNDIEDDVKTLADAFKDHCVQHLNKGDLDGD